MTQPNTTSSLMTFKSQKEILSIATAYFQSSILFALHKLQIFKLIGVDSKSLDELAEATQTNPKTLLRLLNAAVGVDLLITDNENNFQLSQACRLVMLPEDENNYMGDWVFSLDFYQTALVNLDQAVRSSAPTVDPTLHHGTDQSMTKDFRTAMNVYAALPARELAEFLDISAYQSLLDVGSGPGTYAYELARCNPELRLTLLDLPQIIGYAKELHKQYSLENKVDFLGLDALEDDIPGSYDLVLISNTLQMLGEASSRKMIQRLFDVVNPGGSIIIQGQFLAEAPQEAQWPLFFDLIMLCTSESGHNHSVSDTRSWLADAGFVDIEYHAMSVFNPCSIVRGYKA